MKTRNWKLTWETMDGTIRTTVIRALDLDDAIDVLCRDYQVGNLLGWK